MDTYGTNNQNNQGGYPGNPYYPQQDDSHNRRNPNQQYPNQQYHNQQPAGYPTASPHDLGRPYDMDNPHMKSFEQDEKERGILDNFSKLEGDEERQGFVIKVFSIMTVQVAFTALFTAFIISDKGRMQF
jgi:hypothetical protein